MKNFKMLVLVATFSFAVTGVCFALASGHSRHPCAPEALWYAPMDLRKVKTLARRFVSAIVMSALCQRETNGTAAMWPARVLMLYIRSIPFGSWPPGTRGLIQQIADMEPSPLTS